MESVTLKPGRYSISRIEPNDRAGDSGTMLKSLKFPGMEQVGEMGEIRVGCNIQCGSAFGRTFASDWWCTTTVQEIVSVNEDKTEVVFRTNNSVYKARSF